MNLDEKASGRRQSPGAGLANLLFSRAGRKKQPVPGVTRGTRARAERGTEVVVVGGGIAGVAAAFVLAERGVKVTLLEKEGHLGGRVGAWTERMPDGTAYQMERGFHAFFRQYYNLRALISRVDPDLRRLVELADYPILGADGSFESFAGLPKTPPLNLLALLRRTPTFTAGDLLGVDALGATHMLTYDPVRTYEAHDARDAADYLESLRFPARARQMLFDVFARSFFNPEGGMSTAEMLMYFHFYFVGNPEGLIFDVLSDPFSNALWAPLARYLESKGAEIRYGTTVSEVARAKRGWAVLTEAGETLEADALILALHVPGLKQLVARSPVLAPDATARRGFDSLAVTPPYAIWRLFLDRRARPERYAFVGTSGAGMLDNISLFERFEGESRRLAAHRGSIVELHAYACLTEDEQAIKADLLRGLEAFYPELRGARILHDSWMFGRDCSSFPPGRHAVRPTVRTAHDDLMLAGDFVRMPFPTALMERSASSGMLAANHLLDRWDVRGETLHSIPPRGLLAGIADGAPRARPRC